MLGSVARVLGRSGSGLAGDTAAATQLLQKRFLNIHEYQARS